MTRYMDSKGVGGGQSIPGLQVLHLNLRGSFLSLQIVTDYARSHDIDVLLLQDIPSALLTSQSGFCGFQKFLSLGQSDTQNTTAVLVARGLAASNLGVSSPRVTGVLLKWGSRRVGLLSAYIQSSTARGLQDLQQATSAALAISPWLLIGMDSNGHSPSWGPGNVRCNHVGHQIEDFTIRHKLQILNDPDSPPTFVSNVRSFSWIDVSAASSSLAHLCQGWQVIEKDFHTDHYPVLVRLNVHPDHQHHRLRFDWKATDWTLFRTTLGVELRRHGLDPDAPSSPRHLDQLVYSLSSALQAAISATVPTKRVSKFSKPWWSEKMAELRRNVNRAHFRWIRSRLEQDHATFMEARRIFKKEIRAAKRSMWRDFAADTNDNTLWDRLQRVSRGGSNFTVQELSDGNGRWARTDDEKAAALEPKFFPQDTTPLSSEHHAKLDQVDQWFAEHPSEDCQFPPVTSDEIRRTISEMRALGAPGWDDITDLCLRHSSDLVVPYIKAIAEGSFKLHYFPSCWKEAQVIPLRKANRDPHTLGGYRPISLLSVLGKVIENVVKSRLTHWLETHKKLSNHQFGFRRHRSTEWAIWNFVAAASHAVKNRRQLWVVSLDMHAAYDTIWGPGLLLAMQRKAVPGYLIYWAQSFINTRSASLQVGSANRRRHLELGVPQGSPLSPILFLLYVESLLERVAAWVHIQAYADDLLLWLETDRCHSGIERLQQALHQVDSWAADWRMKFSADKSSCMCVSRLRNTLNPPPLFFGGQALKRTTSFRYLGVILDSKLSWFPHIREVAARSYQRLRLIHKFCGVYWGMHPCIARRLVMGAVIPLLFYAAPVWASVTTRRTTLRPLERVLRLSALLITGLIKSSSSDAAIFISGLLLPELEIKRRLLDFWLRMATFNVDIRYDSGNSSINSFCAPDDILRAELHRLQRQSVLPDDVFNSHPNVERRMLWPYPPQEQVLPFQAHFPDRKAADSLLRAARQRAPDTALWISSDGSVTAGGAGAAAVITMGSSRCFFGPSCRSMGVHSSTQLETEGVRLGLDFLRCVQGRWAISELHLISDSQAAILGLISGHNTSELVVDTRRLLQAAAKWIPAIHFMWVPGHSDIAENEAADEAATTAAAGIGHFTQKSLPHCASSLKTKIFNHFCGRMDCSWRSLSSGQGLRDCGWRFCPSVNWAGKLSRCTSSIVAQFLVDHFPCRSFLFKKAFITDPSCRFCNMWFEDRHHIFAICPKYDHIREHCQEKLQNQLEEDIPWELSVVVQRGLPVLATFLRHIKIIWDKQQGGTSWGWRT